ncbi:hypothetical protein DM807_17425 [Pseudomonas hunanensis]|nr:hypothetical protein [Pseudomonas hunanensis]RNF76541.1 hypothetical protein EFJ98_00500 [Pseudomonas putida]
MSRALPRPTSTTRSSRRRPDSFTPNTTLPPVGAGLPAKRPAGTAVMSCRTHSRVNPLPQGSW